MQRLPHDRYQLGVQTVQVRLIPQFGGERFQGLPRRVVVAPEKAPVDERLDAPTKRVEKRRYRERRDDHRKLGLLLLAR